jgi:uncharacterized protein YabN with tetrapyrrole methylase and pyrophosphatase domain
MKEDLIKRVELQEIDANNFGFSWETIHQLINQIRSECDEVLEAYEKKDQSHLQEEIGDLMQASICLAVFCGLDAHETLLKSSQKFQKRLDTVMSLAKKDGHSTLHNQPFDVLMGYWNQAKSS